MSIAAVLVAAGRGSRFGGFKQFAPLLGRSIIEWSARPLAQIADTLVIVCSPQHHEHVMSLVAPLKEKDASKTHIQTVTGGDTRQASVLAGLEALEKVQPDQVIIHDAARPGLCPQTLISLSNRVRDSQYGCVAGLPIQDALHRCPEGVTGNLCTESLDRADIWRAQTPQIFPFQDILSAHRSQIGTSHLDDCALACAAGLEVEFHLGTEAARKVTTPSDLEFIETILMARHIDSRTATGFDVHAFGPPEQSATTWLCGIEVPSPAPLMAHSDGDVGLHALVDALLGTLGAGDIGKLFPPSEETWKGANSRIFVEAARQHIADAKGLITHVDVTLICEQPKIGPHRNAMRDAIANMLHLDIARTNIKATTTESLGFLGRREGIAALATATVRL